MTTPEEKNVPVTMLASLNQNASIKNIFGEPIETQGKTIVPVAQVVLGFGAGAGSGKKDEAGPEKEATGEGSGGGAGLITIPKGVFEITAKKTRFIPVTTGPSYLVSAMLGLLVGWTLSERSSKGKTNA